MKIYEPLRLAESRRRRNKARVYGALAILGAAAAALLLLAAYNLLYFALAPQGAL